MSSGAGAAGGAAGAGVAATAGGDAAGQGEATNGNGHGQGGDIAALAEQLGAMSSSQEEMRQQLQQWVEGAQQQPDQWGDDGDNLGLPFADDELGGYDDDPGGFGDPGDFDGDPAQMAEEIAHATDRYVQAAVAPLEQRLQEMQMDAEWRQIAEEFPDLGDVDVARETFEAAGALAAAKGWPGEVATSPGFVKLTYLAMAAIRHAQEEAEMEQPDAAHLEGGAGAAGGQSQGETNPLLQALDGPPGGSKVLPF